MTTTRTGVRHSVKLRTVTTTTLEITRPASFAQLERRFYVERYVLPDDLRYNKANAAMVFAQIHTALRDQLECAYKAYKFDRLDGTPHWAVYALFPRDVEPTAVTLPWRGPRELSHRTVSFAEIPFHITVKLLQIALFRGTTSSRFVGQDNCYAYACPDGRDFHLCVRVELRGARDTRDTDPIQEFRVIPHATRFGPADLARVRPWDPVFGKRAVGSRFYFLHLKTGQAEHESMVYHEVRFPDRRAHVKYHDLRDLDAGRGKIVADFIQAFLTLLQDFGISGSPRRRTLRQFKAPGGIDLDLSQLGTVGVYDNRLARDTHPLATYVELFSGMRPDVAFVEIGRLADVPKGGVLVLLDATASDFAEEGVLAGRQDPYQLLYRTTPAIPKQSLVVNFNDPDALDGRDYLDYPFPGAQHEQDLVLRLETALSELYLKCAIVHGHEEFPLPLVPSERAFVRRHCYDGETYTMALWFQEGRLRFADLGDPSEREAFLLMASHWGVDYGARFEELRDLHGRDEDPPEYDLIMGPDLFVVIEDLNERVLYAYGDIERRRRERTMLRPISDFKLGVHYDALRIDGMLPLAELMRAAEDEPPRDALGLARPSGALARSQAYYQQLLEFDRLLDDIAITHPTISLNELTGDGWIRDIARILGSSRVEGKPSRRILLEKYRKLGRFLSDRSDDVQLSQGIWDDESGAFVVGTTTPMNIGGQENAHLLRRFRIIQGEAHFDCGEYLAAMAVQFVRPRQYTVSPYYFHLIDLHVMNMRRYAS